ncbi:MAG TPA: CorA family divalent cation transporter [Methyloceanibacter sp.]|nr:CorA family divalent cation transporter [Methyloceanibacter sp.]
MQFAPTTRADGTADPAAKALPGLIAAFRINADGSAEELRVDQPIDAAQGWLWLHFNLADARACAFLKSSPELPPVARELLIAPDGHQQLHANEACVYGVFADLVCGLDGATDEIGFLHFAMTERFFVTSRRQSLNALEATRRALRAGRRIETPASLLETIIENMIETVESYSDGLAEDLDKVEERIMVAEASDQHQSLARVRKVAVRLHRQLATQRALIHRFERAMERSQAPLQFATAKLAQRLDWLDHELIALRDRAHLLQEEVSLKMADQTNRNLQVLAIVTTVFLPASLIAAIFGMNVGGLPLTADSSGFAWALVLLVAVSGFVVLALEAVGHSRAIALRASTPTAFSRHGEAAA